jgi:CDP-diacylglycerol--glycerol-3-phosphate 3-phosphatidyltransferase
MPTLYDLKPKFQALLRPMMSALHGMGITANLVTVSAMLASIAYGAWMALSLLQSSANRLSYLLLPLFLLLRMALNAIDGMLARECHQQSKLGAILNETGDVVSDAALYAPFAMLPEVHPALVAVIVLLAVLTEFIGVLGQVIGGGRRYDGPLGKSDRALVFGLLGLLFGLHIALEPYFNPAFAVIAVLLLWTVIHRTRQALRYASL